MCMLAFLSMIILSLNNEICFNVSVGNAFMRSETPHSYSWLVERER